MARLLDCFGVLLDLGAQLGAEIEAGRVPADAPAPHARVLAGLQAARQQAERLGMGAENIESASFAIVAWIDEMISRHPQWADPPTLQSRLFNSSKASSEFFHHLASLRPEQGELREIYWLVLVLGFKGQYHFEQDDLGELGKLKALHAQQLPTVPCEPGRLAQERITPQQPLASTRPRVRAPERRERAFMRTASAVAVLIPLLYWGSHLLKPPPPLANRPANPQGGQAQPAPFDARHALEAGPGREKTRHALEAARRREARPALEAAHGRPVIQRPRAATTTTTTCTRRACSAA